MPTKAQFGWAFVRYCWDVGLSFDEWDINVNWKRHVSGDHTLWHEMLSAYFEP